MAKMKMLKTRRPVKEPVIEKVVAKGSAYAEIPVAKPPKVRKEGRPVEVNLKPYGVARSARYRDPQWRSQHGFPPLMKGE